MKKIKAWLADADYPTLIAAFFVPTVVLLLIQAALSCYPFGESSVLVLDLNGQYVYFFEGLRKIIHSGQSILYSWSRAMGGEFLGIFAYYLASPFSLIVALFREENITEALFVIELLKCGACGLTMAYYLHRSHKGAQIAKVIFSTLYALCGYAVVYGHNIMWIDALIYLPLITLGIEKLISERKYKLFVITLYLCVSATFYIGYMVCIWVVLYFFYYYFSRNDGISNNFYGEKAHFIKSLLRIGFFSLIACAMAAWILMPTYTSLQFGKNTFQKTDFTFAPKFTFFEFFAKFLFGSYDTVRPEGLPIVYCGMLTLLLFPLYFLSKKVKAREKIWGGVLVGILCFSMAASTVDIIWHGLQRPNWLNYRYSFMLVFIMLVFSYRAFCEIKDFDYRIITAIAASVCVLIFIVQQMKFTNTPDLTCIWISAGLVLIYLVALHPVKHEYLGKGGALILCVIVLVETYSAGLFNLNALDNDVTISSRTSYQSFLSQYRDIVDEVKSKDTSFYRMEKTSHRKTNDNFSLGINGLSNSTSTLNASQIKFLNQMGYSSKSHWSEYLGGTPVSDAILGLKYIIYNSMYPNDLYELYASDESNSTYAYYNPYSLSVAFASSKEINTNFKIDSFVTPFELMNKMVGAFVGKDSTVELFRKIEIEETKTENVINSSIQGHTKYTAEASEESAQVTYTITAPDDKTVYMFIPSDYPREVNIYVNGSPKGTFFGNETDRIVELGKYEAGRKLNVTLSLTEENLYIDKSSDFYFASLDEDLYRSTFEALKKGNFNITEHSSTRLYGNITMPKGMTTLFTTIPYDEGWVLKVDGKVTPIIKTANALISANLSEGTHEIELCYNPKCFTVGLTVSAFAVLIFATVCIFERNYRKKEQKHYEQMYINSYM
ncbi:MAG: YfhO family protein [Clostridia bacterium]|nr:YfhO family protein [Clostridia bacterium]